jgi:D-alanine-D-alanine ligase
MNVGITFNLKQSGPLDPSLPDDAQEEFDSPETIEAIAGVLRGLGHKVTLLGEGRDFLEKVLASPPDFVLNYAEGTGISRSREARVPAVLEMLGIPFSGSDPLTMAVTLDKETAKTLAAAAGVPVPRGYALGPNEPLSAVPPGKLIFPLVAKPAWEGSSKGIRSKSLVKNPADLPAVVADLRRDHRQTILLEEYIAGDEVTVGVLGNDDVRVLGAMRVIPLKAREDFIYSLEMKREWQANVRYEAPAKLDPKATAALESAAVKAYRALGCRDVARVDFRVRDGAPYFLEVNPLPGLSPETSDLMILARGMGYTYERLIAEILDIALRRVGLAGQHSGRSKQPGC